MQAGILLSFSPFHIVNMDDVFLGEIRILPFSFAPRGWALCQGQLLPIRTYTALFSLLGTQYGGDGQSTFALPDLRGRAIVGPGQGPGLSSYPQGITVGTETVTLQATQLPQHNHPLGAPAVTVSGANATAGSPAGGYFTNVSPETFGSVSGSAPMAAGMVSGPTTSIGGNQPHNNQMPYLALNYCIAMQGQYPQRQ
jgi:microcystin-dependent protein